MKNRKIKFSLSILVGLSLIIYLINFFSNAANELSKNSLKIEKEAPEDYLNLFNSPAKNHMVLQSATSFALRNAIADFNYRNEYNIEVTKINITPDFKVESDILEIGNNNKGFDPETITSYNGDDFKIDYNGVSFGNTSHIYLTLCGDSTHYYKNDSVACYYSRIKEAYIQYHRNGIYEVAIKTPKKFLFFNQKKDIMLKFVKKSNFLYLIILRSKNGKKALVYDILNEITK